MAASLDKNEIRHVDKGRDSTDGLKSRQVVQIDNVPVLGLGPSDAEFYMSFTKEQREKVIHKVSKSYRLKIELSSNAQSD